MRGGTDVSPSSSTLIALKPRQVLLLEQQQRSKAASTLMAKNKPEEATQLKPEDELILAFSVALWLENKGYSKVLKRFLSAAQIQDDNWKDKALNLNEIFFKYLEICSSAHENLKSLTKQEEHVVGTTENNGDANGTFEEIQSKKKKKKSKEDVAVNEKGRKLEVTCKKINKTYADGNEEESHKAPGLSHKDQNSKASEEPNGDKVPEITEDQLSKKQKEKKKKKSKLTDADEKKIDVIPEATELKGKGSLSMSFAAELLDRDIPVDKKSKKQSSEGAEDGPDESKKASKKRKRMTSDENENKSGHEVAVEESKSKKSKGLEEGKGEIFEAGRVGLEKISAKQNDESSKNAINNSGQDKSSQKKSVNRQPNSSEPKTVTVFQRVKADEVEFVDERLQDNSYWAKDGAETGYGAKAEEVLGRVKGRDFRHEKTKKKRGSYRGGQIDLQSHSIKFNYSDEE